MIDRRRLRDRHTIGPAKATAGATSGWTCRVCGRPIVQYEYFRLIRDEYGRSSGLTERVVAWRHKQEGRR